MLYPQVLGDYSGYPNTISKENKRARRNCRNKYQNNKQNSLNKRNNNQSQVRQPKNDKNLIIVCIFMICKIWIGKADLISINIVNNNMFCIK